MKTILHRSIIQTVALIMLCFVSTVSFAQTPYAMSNGTYTQDFANIANTTNFGNSFAGSGTDDNPYGVAVAP
ncbi:hypothetical protein [Flavobacterium sp. 3HN19-14]|uniref:hypothetical protein n=1 Tax=Flavobacterium sp. 3HN19-14 TaxID=3448133 RepID=UPI003EDF1CDB